MLHAVRQLWPSPVYRVGGAVLLLATAVILTALGFEHIAGYMPCPLCLEQRYAYYAGIPALVVALVLLGPAQRRTAAAIIFLLVALAFVANAGLGIYQAGAEWKLWDPPASCSAPSTMPNFDLKRESFDRIPASCGVASWRFLGLSFAGWNAVASLILAGGAAAAAVQGRRGPA